MTQRLCPAMCLLAAIGLLAPRFVFVLMWLINSRFVLQPFGGTRVPNPVLPILGLLFLPTTTLGYCWAAASFGGVSSFSGLLVLFVVEDHPRGKLRHLPAASRSHRARAVRDLAL